MLARVVFASFFYQ